MNNIHQDLSTIIDSLRVDALDVAKKAGELLLKEQKHVAIQTRKDVRDFSTNADMQAEELIISTIEQKYPNHSILSEERGLIDKQGDFKWIIDPLDGTQNYYSGSADFSTLIAVEHQHELVLGVSYFPRLNEYAVGVRNGPSLINDTVVNVSNNLKLEDSKILIHIPRKDDKIHSTEKALKLVEKIGKKSYQVFVHDFDVAHMNELACGLLDGYMRLSSSGGWWDVAASIPVIEGARGKVSTLKGSSLQSEGLPYGFVASNSYLHDDLLDLLRQVYL